MNRAIGLSIALVVLTTTGLAIAIGVGIPDPGAAERAYAAVVGATCCVLGVIWLRMVATGTAPEGRLGVLGNTEDEDKAEPPVVEASRSIERALRLGASTMGEFSRLVEPRLRVLTAARLRRSGIDLADTERAREQLGDSWDLVDPNRPPPPDRMAPGVSLTAVEQLLDALERLP
ncbi:MAG TPA: hypothetical protein VKA05_03520 [Acidimicrobiales bacterium]|nr:hypothetical protein [Acidimicrobiales bacterium]